MSSGVVAGAISQPFVVTKAAAGSPHIQRRKVSRVNVASIEVIDSCRDDTCVSGSAQDRLSTTFNAPVVAGEPNTS